MSSTSLVRSGYARDWAEPPLDRRRGGSSGGFSRFLVSVGIGVGATLGWQAYGDMAREMLAASYPQLGWLSPRATAGQSASAAGVTPVRSPDSQAIQELTLSLAAMRQRIDQLAIQLTAGQDQMTRDIAAKMQAAQRDIMDKIAASQLRPEPTRRPASQASAQSSQLR